VLTTGAGARHEALPHFFLERYLPSYEREWQAFVQALQSGTPPPVGAADARAPLVIGLAALQSLREGRAVRVDEVMAP
jgi:myo-inositol 2-dehydrogenase/D-chiro-inositol 1-dehydrogenase